jgi:hypothetical protein
LILNDSVSSFVLSALAERTKVALPSEPMSLELLISPDEKSLASTSEPESGESS